MVGHKFLRDIKACNNMVEEIIGCCFNQVIECGNYLDPFGKLVNNNDYVLVFIARGGINYMKAIPHLQRRLVVMTRWRRVGGAQLLVENI